MAGRINHGLVALGSAAVLAVYAAGYVRTRAAAERIAEHDARRGTVPAPAPAAPVNMPSQSGLAPVERPPDRKPLRETGEKARRSSRKTVASNEIAASPSPVPAVPPPAAPVATPAHDLVASETKPVEPAPTPPLSSYKDGTYFGWGTSRHGDIQAAVVIENGRIVSAKIAQCLTRYSCSWIDHLQGQVVSRQSPEVDYVSGATQSTNAFYYAVVEALAKAR